MSDYYRDGEKFDYGTRFKFLDGRFAKKDKTMWVYRLSYTVWHNGTETRINNDIVQFTEPQSLNDIITGLWHRYVMLRDENVSIGNATIELLSS